MIYANVVSVGWGLFMSKMMSNEGSEAILTPVDLFSNALTSGESGLPGGNGARLLACLNCTGDSCVLSTAPAADRSSRLRCDDLHVGFHSCKQPLQPGQSHLGIDWW